MATLEEMSKTKLARIIMDHLIWFVYDDDQMVSFDSLIDDVEMTEDGPATLRNAVEEYWKKDRGTKHSR